MSKKSIRSSPSHYIATVSVLTAMGIVLHAVENFLPSPALPGAKLGLANIITVSALIFLNFQTGLATAFLRVLIGSLVTGTMLSYTFFLSLAGSICSVLMMGILINLLPKKQYKSILLLLSTFGAISHNLGQLGAAYLIVGKAVMSYLPNLIVFAIPTGLFTGELFYILSLRLRIGFDYCLESSSKN